MLGSKTFARGLWSRCVWLVPQHPLNLNQTFHSFTRCESIHYVHATSRTPPIPATCILNDQGCNGHNHHSTPTTQMGYFRCRHWLPPHYRCWTSGFQFTLPKNSLRIRLRLNFDSMTCLNYLFLDFFHYRKSQADSQAVSRAVFRPCELNPWVTYLV